MSIRWLSRAGATRQTLILLATTLALASCGGGRSTPSAKSAAEHASTFVPPSTDPTTVAPSTSTTTTVPTKPSDAQTIATALGCKTTDPVEPTPIGGLPTPKAEVSCTVAGVDLDVSVFASHADLVKVSSPAANVILCSFLKAFGQTGPFYEVNGADFMADASTTPPNGGASVGTAAEAQALGHALGLPVTTIKCPTS